MADIVAILEDDGNRISAMQACLAKIIPSIQITFFENAHEMIAWLHNHLSEAVLISLDHDLPLRVDEGKTIDYGTGRQVADYLASMPPTCPVIVHSSNDVCAQGMYFELTHAGWHCRRIYPRDGEAWIPNAWAEQVRQFIADRWIVLGGI